MLQEKDMNVLTADIQERQENTAANEDQEEFEKLKEVIPTVCQTDSSQVDLFVRGTRGGSTVRNVLQFLSSN